MKDKTFIDIADLFCTAVGDVGLAEAHPDQLGLVRHMTEDAVTWKDRGITLKGYECYGDCQACEVHSFAAFLGAMEKNGTLTVNRLFSGGANLKALRN